MKWANQRLWYYLKSFFGVGRNKAGRSGHEAGYHVLIIVGVAADAAVPPWVGYNEEEQMKAQILELSAVRENHPQPFPSQSHVSSAILSPGQPQRVTKSSSWGAV